MSDSNTVRDLNDEMARKIHEEAQRNPNSPYANKYVEIANGRDVGASDDLDELDRLLQEAEPDGEKCFCAWIDPNTHLGAANESWACTDAARTMATLAEPPVRPSRTH